MMLTDDSQYLFVSEASLWQHSSSKDANGSVAQIKVLDYGYLAIQ